MPLPHLWVRRLVVGPGVVLAALLLVTTLPVWVFVAVALAALVPRAMRVARVLWLVTFYLVWDSAALVVLFVLWVASGFGWKIRAPAFQRAHYVVAGAFLGGLFRQGQWVLRLRVDVTGEDPDSALPGTPLIVASRHGGPGDSIILVHALINWYHREPRIVLKDTLQWDPAVDVLLNRVPTRFIAPSSFDGARPRRGRSQSGGLVQQVGDLASGLDANDALVIFPEGGQFTHTRRAHRIATLIKDGRHAMAARAEAMRNVMAPRPGGLLAALDAAPDAGVMFVGHTGLERLSTVGALWRELPMDKRIVLRGWKVPRAEIPEDRADRIEWLFTWWERIDVWIEGQEERSEAF